MIHRSGLVAVGVVVLSGALAGCAPRTVVPATGEPRYPDYVYPVVPDDLAVRSVGIVHENGWKFLQAGDFRNAEREFGAVLERMPEFYPAEAGLGYLELARRNYEAALVWFEAALGLQPAYAPALAGKGEALLATERVEEALAAFEAAVGADESLAGVRRRVEVLRFRGLEADVAQARAAVGAGRLSEAREMYVRALRTSPDSPFLLRELADVERRLADVDSALTHARRAVELEPDDARSLQTLAEIHVARADYAAAIRTLEQAVEVEPDDTLRRRLAELRELSELAGMPAEYRAISGAGAIRRADLAALIGVRLSVLVGRAPQREGVFITDTRDHWATTWILTVARAGIMEVYPNYTFQPGALVRRAELATVVSRVLMLVTSGNAALAAGWRAASFDFADLPPAHLTYPAAAMAVAAGIMAPREGGAFEPGGEVTGPEAVAVVRRLEALARTPAR